MVKIICIVCGKVFNSRHSTTKSCSKICKSINKSRKPLTAYCVKSECANCKKILCQKGKHTKRFCGKLCFNRYTKFNDTPSHKKSYNRRKLNCLYCHRIFYRKPSYIFKRTFCTNECVWAWRLENPKTKPKLFNCMYCNKEKEYMYEKPKFCSKSCNMQYKIKNGLYNNPMGGEKAKKMLSARMKKYYADPIKKEQIQKSLLKGLFKRPTSLEQDVMLLCKDSNIPFKYVGDGSFFIGHAKNPDFINVPNKICIEARPKIMCKIWSKQTPEEYEKQQVDFYKKHGWRCLLVWHEDLQKNKNGVINYLKNALEEENGDNLQNNQQRLSAKN